MSSQDAKARIDIVLAETLLQPSVFDAYLIQISNFAHIHVVKIGMKSYIKHNQLQMLLVAIVPKISDGAMSPTHEQLST